MASTLSLISSALLSIFLSSYSGLAVADHPSFRVVSVEALKPLNVCSGSSSKARGGNIVRIVHRDGACSPSGVGKPDHLQILYRDSLRVASLQSRIRQANASPKRRASTIEESQVSLPAKSGEVIGSGDYVVTVGFGTPRRDQTVIFDTGSSVSWIQCEPCVASCYKQKEPLFDPSSSSSYRNVSCSSETCDSLETSGCSQGTCLYSVRYGDNSSTVGFLATDKLTLSRSAAFPTFVFGCGERNEGLFNGAAGLIGLGRSRYSLVSQASKTLDNVFSYCLPRSISSTGYLTIGKSSTASSVVYTPMLSDELEGNFYFIKLVGISVGRRRLPVGTTVFGPGIIDSGTVITRLPTPTYFALRSAFTSAMSQYRVAPPVSILDTCYDFSGVKNVSHPTITLHYDGADVPLESDGVFIDAEGSHCLAFAANGGPGDIMIIGNVQQRGMEVIYDIGAQNVGFAAGACS